MGSLGDSNAIKEDQRQFAQHQAIITIIQGILPDPNLKNFRWLDLACGKGQIIMHLEDNIHHSLRSKIEYFGYDIKDDYLKIAEEKASTLELKSYDFEVGDISKFPNSYNLSRKFECITLTNAIHEISPNFLATLLFESFIRLNDDGFLFIYDMEEINPIELGAIPWKNLEFDEILSNFFCYMNVDYCPSSGGWLHSSCRGWNIQLKRRFYDLDISEVINRRDEIINKTNNCIKNIIDKRYNTCKQALESLTKFGASTSEESDEIPKNLYQFWALSRAMEGFK